jgi:tRNA uridine 5-carbamoylmethylation protein Kti12
MIIFTAGYPFSGKTTFATELTKLLAGRKVIHIDPASFRPPEYDTISSEDQSRARIASWEVAQEQLTDSMVEPDGTIIIFDTCAAKAKNMLQHFVTARANNHQIMYVFMATTLTDCRKRSGSQWPSQEVIDGYARDFNESLPRLRKTSDRFFVIKNIDDEQASLKTAVIKIARIIADGQIGGIRKPKPLRGPTSRPRQKNRTRTPIRPRRSI